MSTADALPKTSPATFRRKVARVADGASVASASEVRGGLPILHLDDLAATLGLAADDLAQPLGVSTRTLLRRRSAGRLGPAESDRLWRLRDVHRLTLEAFDGRQEEARVWLTTPKRGLSGDTPVQHLDTEPGARLVRQMLATMEHTMPA